MSPRPRIHVCRPGGVPRASSAAALPLRLARRAIATARVRSEPLEIRVATGALWITIDGVADDVVLEAGQCAVFEGRGLVVMEALADSTAQVTTVSRRAA